MGLFKFFSGILRDWTILSCCSSCIHGFQSIANKPMPTTNTNNETRTKLFRPLHLVRQAAKRHTTTNHPCSCSPEFLSGDQHVFPLPSETQHRPFRPISAGLPSTNSRICPRIPSTASLCDADSSYHRSGSLWLAPQSWTVRRTRCCKRNFLDSV